jgi:hypothetical protein
VNGDICNYKGISDGRISHTSDSSGFVCSSQYTCIFGKMEMIMKKLIIVFLFLFIVWPFFFMPQGNAMPLEKRSDIIKLLKISGVIGMANKMAIYASNQIIDAMQGQKELTPRIIEIIKVEVSTVINEQILDEQAFFSYFLPIYDKYYTHSEIKGLISFYESELGRKTVRVMPSLTNECIVAGENWGQSIAPVAFDRIAKRLEAEGIK